MNFLTIHLIDKYVSWQNCEASSICPCSHAYLSPLPLVNLYLSLSEPFSHLLSISVLVYQLVFFIFLSRFSSSSSTPNLLLWWCFFICSRLVISLFLLKNPHLCCLYLWFHPCVQTPCFASVSKNWLENGVIYTRTPSSFLLLILWCPTTSLGIHWNLHI